MYITEASQIELDCFKHARARGRTSVLISFSACFLSWFEINIIVTKVCKINAQLVDH